MEFRVPCECGEKVVVTEASAGARIGCRCGRDVRVPALHQLRVSVGLPPYPLTPEMEIEHLLRSSSLPEMAPCARCSAGTTETITVLVRYEDVGTELQEEPTAQEKGTWGIIDALLGSGDFLSGLLPWKSRRVAHNREYQLPVFLCPACQAKVRNDREVRACLTRVELYSRLLEKHPYAVVKRA